MGPSIMPVQLAVTTLTLHEKRGVVREGVTRGEEEGHKVRLTVVLKVVRGFEGRRGERGRWKRRG